MRSDITTQVTQPQYDTLSSQAKAAYELPRLHRTTSCSYVIPTSHSELELESGQVPSCVFLDFSATMDLSNIASRNDRKLG